MSRNVTQTSRLAVGLMTCVVWLTASYWERRCCWDAHREENSQRRSRSRLWQGNNTSDTQRRIYVWADWATPFSHWPKLGVGPWSPLRLRHRGELSFKSLIFGPSFVWKWSRHLGFGKTGNSAIRSADPENPTVEPNMKWIGLPLAEIWPFEIFKIERSVIGRSSVRVYRPTSSNTDLIYSPSLRWEHSLRGVKIGPLSHAIRRSI